ncbi:hypothetical protein V5799_010309 [Amblyomma americanum]|uniref:CRAL-TRIO domain-containing protein n=1 Tax=Amblyomma americanum TaxID=6943 RepID=A0AAQ4F831_AMBAM
MEPGFVEHLVSQTEEITLDGTAEESLAELRKLLEDEPELKASADSTDLLRFLRLRKYDARAALDSLKKYCAIKASAPKIFEGLREPQKIREIAQDFFTILPQKNLHGKPVLFCKFGKWRPSKMSNLQLIQAFVLCLEHLSRCPASQTVGVCVVADFEGWTFANVRSVELGHSRSLLHYMQYCLPVLPNEAHIVRQPGAFDAVYKIVKPFLKEESIKAVNLHGKNVERMHKDIPASALPEDYGGTAPDTDWNAFWKNICLEHESANS